MGGGWILGQGKASQVTKVSSAYLKDKLWTIKKLIIFQRLFRLCSVWELVPKNGSTMFVRSVFVYLFVWCMFVVYLHLVQFVFLTATPIPDSVSHSNSPVWKSITIMLDRFPCVSLNVSSNCLPERMHSNIGCICSIFLFLVFSNVSSNGLLERM